MSDLSLTIHPSCLGQRADFPLFWANITIATLLQMHLRSCDYCLTCGHLLLCGTGHERCRGVA